MNSRALKLLLVSDHGYLPDRCGGREVSTHELAAWYSRDGYDVTVLARDLIAGHRTHSMGGAARFARSWLFRRLSERALPYRVYRSASVKQTLRKLLENDHFDTAILQFDAPHKNLDFDLPPGTRYVVYFRDAVHARQLTADSFPKNFTLVANSAYTARMVAQRTNRAVATIIPYVEKNRYVTGAQGPFVTFINPVPEKGVDLAFRIAESCPDLPFLFVEGWPLSRSARRELVSRVRRATNIRYRKRVSDMRSIYAQTRVLLVPSQWEESWGRVVTECHFSGIPVLASRIGGLPESVGCGGVLIPPCDHERNWAEALRALYVPGRYMYVSALASAQAEEYWAKAQSLPEALLACGVGEADEAMPGAGCLPTPVHV